MNKLKKIKDILKTGDRRLVGYIYPTVSVETKIVYTFPTVYFTVVLENNVNKTQKAYNEKFPIRKYTKDFLVQGTESSSSPDFTIGVQKTLEYKAAYNKRFDNYIHSLRFTDNTILVKETMDKEMYERYLSEFADFAKEKIKEEIRNIYKLTDTHRQACGVV